MSDKGFPLSSELKCASDKYFISILLEAIFKVHLYVENQSNLVVG